MAELPQEYVNRIYEQGVKEFAKWLIDKKVSDYTDIVDLASEYLKEKENECNRYFVQPDYSIT